MPESCYRAKPYYNTQQDPEAKNVAPTLSSSSETIAYVDSDVSEEYWPLGSSGDDADNSDHVECPQCRSHQPQNTNTPACRIIHVRPSQHMRFSVSIHGIHQRR